ncbi:MAG: MBL fold metallo-hydrolase [Anaerolineaceae bacterium]
MTQLDLRFVGTGNAFAPGGLCWNGFLANDRYLFETPPQTLISLNKLGVNANDLEAIILSHHHGDHFLGLPFLLLHWKYEGRTTPVRIVGPPGTEQLTRDIGNRVYPGLFDITYDIEWVVAEPGKKIRIGALELEPVAVKHDTRLDLSLGYSARLGGRRFAYTGDSAICDAVLDLARGAEVLVSECASRDGKIDIHMNLLEDIPQVHAALGPDAQLLLTHLGPGVDSNGLDRTIVARDYQHYRF